MSPKAIIDCSLLIQGSTSKSSAIWNLRNRFSVSLKLLLFFLSPSWVGPQNSGLCCRPNWDVDLMGLCLSLSPQIRWPEKEVLFLSFGSLFPFLICHRESLSLTKPLFFFFFRLPPAKYKIGGNKRGEKIFFFARPHFSPGGRNWTRSDLLMPFITVAD